MTRNAPESNRARRRGFALIIAGAMGVGGVGVGAMPAAAAPGDEIHVCATCDHTTIQAAVAAASPGDTVIVAPGAYTGKLTVPQGITLVGAGSGTDPQSATILSGTTGDGLVLTGSEEWPVEVRDIRVTGFNNGVVVKGSDVRLERVAGSGNNNYGINLDDGVTRLEIVDSEFNGNGAGMKIGSKNSASYITISGSHFDDNRGQGWYSDKNAASGSTIDHVTITDSTFNRNGDKGFYTEKLSHAVFDDVQFNESGNEREQQGAGLDINLKYGEYQDIALIDVQAIDSGIPATPNGSGIAIAARNDGAYASQPAELAGVTIIGGRVTGAVNGLSFGQAIAGDIVVRDVDLAGNEVAIRNATDGTVVLATPNWWGAAAPGFASLVVGEVVTSPWYEDSAMTVLRAHADGSAPVVPVPEQGAVHIVIPDDVDDPGLDVTDLLDEDDRIIIPDGLTVTSQGGTELSIPAGTTITPSAPGWGTEFTPPVVVELDEVVLPDGDEAAVTLAIEVGSPDVAFTLDRAARILLPGAAGSRVGFIEPGGEFTLIDTPCAADTQTAGDAVARDCFIDVGDDLVVWTKHFTTFAALATAALPATGVDPAPGAAIAVVLGFAGMLAMGLAARRRIAAGR